MRERLEVIATTLILASSFAWAQGAAPPSLQDQLSAQYKLVKMGSDSSGPRIVEAGTLLAIQKGGILSVPYADTNSKLIPNKYADGKLSNPGASASSNIAKVCKWTGRCPPSQVTPNTQLLPQGSKVYPSNIDVNMNKDTITMGIVACDTCNNNDPPTYKAQIVFQFHSGTLAKSGAGDVEDTIGQLLAISNDDQQAQDGQQQQADQPQAPQPAAPQPEPQTIQLGMTPDQVEAALGKPEQQVNLGAKQLYVYKNLKVTFLGGKVSDVQ